MAFSNQQVAEFCSLGYLVVPGFFTERETRALQNEVERLKEEGALRNVATEGDGKTASATKRNLQLCPAFTHSNLIRALPFETKVVNAISQLIGDPAVLHLDQIFLKPGGDGMGTNWHQDNAYFKIDDPLKGTAMWIAIHDADDAANKTGMGTRPILSGPEATGGLREHKEVVAGTFEGEVERSLERNACAVR
jgi:phytanoyl-CoA hydroxylase